MLRLHFSLLVQELWESSDLYADSATQRGHKTINENRKANLDNENIFIFISVLILVLISPKNLKDQKILIDIFNSPVGSIMSRLRRTSERERELWMWQRSRNHRKNNHCGKEETCFIQINSFCISNETNLDFCSQLSSPNDYNLMKSHKKFVFDARHFKFHFPDSEKQVFLSPGRAFIRQ